MLEPTLAPIAERADRWPSEPRLATIQSVATELPPGRLTSAELAASLGISEQWILSRTGIRERRRVRRQFVLGHGRDDHEIEL